MHELGIVFNIIDTVEDIAKEQNLTEVSSVTLQVGEVSTVIPHYLEDCWKWAVKKTEILKECKLIHEPIEAITFCEDCGKTYRTVDFGKTCPHCGSEHTYLVVGNEVQIKEIEAC